MQQNSNDLMVNGDGIEEPRSNDLDELKVEGCDEPEWKGKGSS